MLERATACLKSGAPRESLKLVQRGPRSQRMLHSTFWNHGAGGLDLPPWVVSALPMPSDLPLKHNNTSPGRRRSEKGIETEFLRNSSAVFEGVFLDFLYPPQALAWLQRAKAQQWEKRNARRLPEGFVVASRGYASSSQVQDTVEETVTNEKESSDDVIDGEPGESGSDWIVEQHNYRPFHEESAQEQKDNTKEQSPGAQNIRSESASITADNAHWETESRLQAAHAGKSPNGAYDLDLQFESSTRAEFADSPSDLAEDISSVSHTVDLPAEGAGAVDPMQSLRQVMMLTRSGRAKNSSAIIDKALSIYDALDEGTKNDIRLRRELVEWLSVQHNEVSQIRCMKLYYSLPSSERTLQTYQAALSVLFDRRQFTQIPGLHEEALQNLENGHQISRMLFSRAVEDNRWTIAIQAERTHSERYQYRQSGANQASQIRIFWLHISEMPQLLRRAIQLARHLQTEKKLDRVDDHTRQFAAAFFKEALTQEFFLHDGRASFKSKIRNNNMPRSWIRHLLNYIASTEGDGRTFFHDLLMQILQPESRARYPQLHEVASFVYAKYCSMPGAQPSEQLLMLWLERMTEYYGKLRKLRRTTNSLSLVDLVREWKKYHEHLSKDAVKRLMSFYAKFGREKPFELWLEYLRSVYPAYEDQKDILWMTIWLHARRADLDGAQQAFAEVKRTTAEQGEEPDIICWNMLLHAHARADDLEGAFINLQNLIKSGGLKPTAQSFHNVLQLLAKRGDVAGVENLLQQYDTLVGEKRGTPLLGSLLLAHCNNDDIQKAETIFQEAILDIRRREIVGPLVGCFNIILTAHAMRRDIYSAMRTYRWMKREGIRRDANSYAAIMQALAFYRRTQEAHGILKRVMPENNIQPTAFHYAILIAGYVNNRQPKMAIELYDTMLRKNIKPSISANAAYLKAKAVTESSGLAKRELPNNQPVALEATREEMKKFLRRSHGVDVADKQPGLGFGDGTINLSESAPAAYFDFLIFVHGQRQCFDAVTALWREYKEDMKKRGRESDTSPLRLLANFAAASYNYGQHEHVEQCWKLAKGQADDKTLLLEVPTLTSSREDSQWSSKPIASDSSASESSFTGDREARQAAEGGGSENLAKQRRTPLIDKQASHLRAPARRHILTRILRYYLLSLHLQGRTADAISTVTQIINQGYTMDNKTWNSFIQSLCQTTPPLALLAYVLTERFLTPHFPGWSPIVQYPPKRESVAEGLEYIKARFLAPGQLMPQYRTVVYMAGALLQLRRLLAITGSSTSHSIQPELNKYVGTIDLIRRHAPKTFFVVQSMPKVPDKLQAQVLRGEGS